MSGRASYVTITSGMRGFFAILMHWDDEGQCWEPWNSGPGSYRSSEEAAAEARAWADAEGLEFRP